jgi:hypothetical protein
MSGSVDSRQGIYDEIDAKFRIIYHELMKNERVNRNCLVILRKAHKLWPSSVKYLKNGLRQEIATILEQSQQTLEIGTPIWVEIDRIIGLLLPPEFASVTRDIIDLWIYSSNEDGTLMEILSACGRVWAEARVHGSLDFPTAKNIFKKLLHVVQTVQKEPDMKNNTRLQYVVKFISDLSTELERQSHMTKRPYSVYSYVKTTMSRYAPPYAPPADDIGTVAEEEEEETAHGDSLNSLYLDIEAKMQRVRDELTKSGQHGECLAFIEEAQFKWPGTAKFFTQDLRRDIAAILGQAQETLDHEGTEIWQQIGEIIRLLVPPGTVAEAEADNAGPRAVWEKGGPWDRKPHPHDADISTLLREMRQLCV